MIHLFYNLALFIAPINSILLTKVLQCPKNPQLPHRKPRPYSVYSCFYTIVGDRKPRQTEIDILTEELLPISLATPSGSGIDNTRYPLSSTPNGRSMHCGLSLPSVVFTVEVQAIVLGI